MGSIYSVKYILRENLNANCVQLAAWLSLVFCLQQSWGATISLNPVADAFVTSGPTGNLSNNNYGAAGGLALSAPGLPQGEFQSVLRFDLSATKSSFDSQFGVGNWSVQSVTLQLTATSPINAIFNANAAGQFGVSLMLNNNWIEGTGTPSAPATTGITFATLPSFQSALDEAVGTFSYGGTSSGSTMYTLALSPTLAADILTGAPVSLRLFAEDSSVSYVFDSRSFGTASSRPLLTISAVPEPGVPALCLLGLGLFAWRRRILRSQNNR